MTDRERRRALRENARRRGKGVADRYAPWNRAERLMVDGRTRTAAEMLHRLGVFPTEHGRYLEIGFGDGGWLPTLLQWKVPERSLHGFEIDPRRAAAVRGRLPSVRLCVGDGRRLPYADGSFDLVVASTVFTSVLDDGVRRALAVEIARLLRPGGALLWYDFAVDNPRNPHVRGIGRRELRGLFPGLRGEIRSQTLAPPLLRPLSKLGPAAVELLATVPFLRTHLLAVLRRIDD